MSDAPSGSGSGTGLPLATKGIGSLAKKPEDVTRKGTQKLKFIPTLPARRKKEEVKAEPAAPAIPTTSTEHGRGRGRGRGRGTGGDSRGSGRGRGVPRPPVEMTASGPFAMGPALAGNNSRRAAPRSNFTPIAAPSATPVSSLGAGLTRTAVPSLRRDSDIKGNIKEARGGVDDEEVYSDPDEGVEIIDMEHVRQMDWMAPESLRKEKTRSERKAKKEESNPNASLGEVDLANALDLSESEEEEELEDIVEDFAAQTDLDLDPSLREERLFFFQFPSPFPTFESTATSPSVSGVNPPIAESGTGKKVSFAGDAKPEASTSKPREVESKTDIATHVDGIIGQLEIYSSGAVKMRLANGILLDVNAATQPSFLQHAVHLDKKEKCLTVLGEVNKRFVVSPDVDALLASMEKSSAQLGLDGEQDLIRMDTT
ncbi:RNA polymerase III RPC4-domain-containing protein [Infundibulicybe gibba]|nr:RNA polymerase III RPC4-domain-containing protein [Infundibulicybe gibba]